MLQSLRVKNLAVVENAVVEFNRGLNVITGETGAGKSVLVGALNLILGERADRDMIRSGEEQCGVEAVFQLADSTGVDAILDELGLDPCEDGRLIVRRLVSASGSGKNFINDSPATILVLKRVAELLVDMHGPYDHQSLLHQDYQLDILDAFGRLWKSRSTYEDAFRKMADLEAQRKALDGDDGQSARQIDMLAFQVKEIEDANLSAGEEEAVEKEHRISGNASRIMELTNGIRNALTEDETACFNSMAAVQRLLQDLADLVPESADWRKEAEAVSIQLQELSNTVGSYAQRIETDPARLQWLDDRLVLIHKLKRKYGASVDDILKHLETSRGMLQELLGRGQKLAQVDADLLLATQEARDRGTKLGKERRTAAESLARAITKELRALGFSNGSFDVNLAQAEAPRPDGLDVIEFGFAPNPGEAMRPLRTIASSGEISRVMLATKSVLASHDRIPVLVFDEIDANVGGEMGTAIGVKLGTVAGHHQVLCITHLPQVAVHGSTHFVVNKEVKSGRTFTTIRRVEGDDRVEELARMLGGRDLTSVTLKHAKELLAGVDRK
ncbi:MAG: DNA repair protein RecN [Verrucomicrobia bacterium]|nr:DNA repair protein RecN [Verrucomicrobiota bacterium]